jgi:hypothetical protein
MSESPLVVKGVISILNRYLRQSNKKLVKYGESTVMTPLLIELLGVHHGGVGYLFWYGNRKLCQLRRHSEE